jgi:hypothetical protein
MGSTDSRRFEAIVAIFGRVTAYPGSTTRRPPVARSAERPARARFPRVSGLSPARQALVLGAFTAACLAVFAVATPQGALALGATSAKSQAHKRARLPIVPRHGRQFVPAVGDWEGISGGLPASFELAYKPSYAVFGTPYGYEDLLTFGPSFSPSPTGCPLSTSATGAGVIGENDVTPLGPGGVFPLAKLDVSGGVRSSTEATLTERLVWPSAPEYAACPKSWSWKLRPASRRAVRDGTWTVQLQNGETQTVEVKAGGRAVEGLAFPSAVGACQGPLGGADMFIAADGIATYSEPAGQVGISLDFSSPDAASGQFSFPAAACGSVTIAMTASLTKASG